MEQRYGTAFTELSNRLIGPGSTFMEKFEKAKRMFRGSHVDDEDIWLPLKLELSKIDPHGTVDVPGYLKDEEYVIITRSSSTVQIRIQS